jgi:hypothetical protein
MPFNVRFLSGLLVCFALGWPAVPSKASDYYRWTDKDGTVHFSDTLGSVPPEYRDQVGTRRFESKKKKTPPSDEPPPAVKADPAPEAAGGPKRYEIPYVAKDAEGSSRIIIPVTFNKSVTASMALDTGAPGMIISPSLAKKIGVFDTGNGKLRVITGGIGGDIPAVRTIVDSVQVGEALGRYVPTTVTPSVSDSFEGLVGMDFMGSYSVFIDTRKRVVIFEEKPESSDWPGGHNEGWWRATFKEFSTYRSGWKKYLARTEREIRDTPVATRSRAERLERIRSYAKSQLAEAKRLFDKLSRFARENSVPMEWR